MRHLIDSDIVFDRFLGQAAATDLLGRLVDDGSIAIGVVTYMEVYQDLLCDPAGGDPRTRIDDFRAGRPVLSFFHEFARRCANLREDLRLKGQRVRSRHLDLINAATAIHHELILVTRYTAGYDDIPGIGLYA